MRGKGSRKIRPISDSYSDIRSGKQFIDEQFLRSFVVFFVLLRGGFGGLIPILRWLSAVL